jgi:hypothetical protein
VAGAIPVNSQVLKWARETSGLSLYEKENLEKYLETIKKRIIWK